MLCSLVLVFFVNLFISQVNSAIVAHDLKCRVYNNNYLKDVQVFFYSDSDVNEFFANFTIVKTFPHDAMGHVKALKRSESGIYNIPTTFQFSRSLCDTAADSTSIFWYTIHKKLFKECPPQPGTYLIERFVLIDNKHEEFFRSSLTKEKVMIIFYMTYKSDTMFYCNVYYDLS